MLRRLLYSPFYLLLFQETDKEISWFWKALESFSTIERQQFLRFVWGRSRLPPAHVAWEQAMEVSMKTPLRPNREIAPLAPDPPATAGAAAAAAADTAPPAVTTAAAAAEGEPLDASPRTIRAPISGEAVSGQYSPRTSLLSHCERDSIQQQIDQMLPQSHTCFFQVYLLLLLLLLLLLPLLLSL